MNQRFNLFRRAGVFYYEDTTTGKQLSLRTKDEAEARTLCKRRLKSAAGVMCVTRRFKSAASSITMKHVSQYERLD
jgi:hypothetical protein